MHRLRISAISYLNTAPLMWDFEHGPAGSEFEISYTIPSDCARALADGSADIGIIPAAAYTTVPDLVIVPDVAIAAKRAVRSILLVSNVPVAKIRTVALDTSSLTSVALTKLILHKWFGGGQRFTAMPPNLGAMLEDHDAALLIGDPALQVNRSKYYSYDLAEVWLERTGKPFVFAFWAIRSAALANLDSGADLPAIFQQSRAHGLERDSLDEIARTWGDRLNLAQEEVRSYLCENIYYFLDSPCLEGLNLFYRYAEECGALPKAPALRFMDVPKVVGL
jgi:chorismate dehydratase